MQSSFGLIRVFQGPGFRMDGADGFRLQAPIALLFGCEGCGGVGYRGWIAFAAGPVRSRSFDVNLNLLSSLPISRVHSGGMGDLRVSTEIQVMYFDTDAAGVIHNIVYLRFIETARTLLAIEMGMSFAEIARTQIHPVVTRTEIDYRKPGVLGDVVRVDAWVSEHSGIRFWCEFEVRRKSDDVLLAKCRQALALVQMPSGRPVRLPAGFPATLSLDGDA